MKASFLVYGKSFEGVSRVIIDCIDIPSDIESEIMDSSNPQMYMDNYYSDLSKTDLMYYADLSVIDNYEFLAFDEITMPMYREFLKSKGILEVIKLVSLRYKTKEDILKFIKLFRYLESNILQLDSESKFQLISKVHELTKSFDLDLPDINPNELNKLIS